MAQRQTWILATLFAGFLAIVSGLALHGTASAQDGSTSQTDEETATSAEIEATGASEAGAEKDAKNKDQATVNEESAAEIDPTAPYKYIKFAKGDKPRIKMETSMGALVIELWPDVAPKHCQSFVHLTKTGYYDSLTFHRVEPGLLLQGGCPLGTGYGNPGYHIPAEFSGKKHKAGILSMARGQDPNSAGSQFFICLTSIPSLDNSYTVFGKVVEGMDVAQKIGAVDVRDSKPVKKVYMTKVTVVEPEE
jgi:peptidyl-prolyl cis-trans isomerase B (cyclophilin B)